MKCMMISIGTRLILINMDILATFSSFHTFFSLRVELSYIEEETSLPLSFQFSTNDTFSKFSKILSTALALQPLSTYPVILPSHSTSTAFVFKGHLARITHQARIFKILSRAFAMLYFEVWSTSIIIHILKIQKLQVMIYKNVQGGRKEERYKG